MSLKEESSLYEIVELDEGDVALRRAGDLDSVPLVTIKFSEESQYFLENMRFEVAKSMIEAGLEAVAELSEEDDDSPQSTVPESTLLH